MDFELSGNFGEFLSFHCFAGRREAVRSGIVRGNVALDAKQWTSRPVCMERVFGK